MGQAADFSSDAAFTGGLQFLILSEEAAKNDGALNLLIVPLAVTAAFACEALLKALIKDETSVPRTGHVLNNLFKQLSAYAQSKVLHSLCEAEGKSEAEIRRYIWDDNTFVEWRYLYEVGDVLRRGQGCLSTSLGHWNLF
jgi:hypothetical protein